MVNHRKLQELADGRIYEEEWEWMIGNGRIDEDSEGRTCEGEV